MILVAISNVGDLRFVAIDHCCIHPLDYDAIELIEGLHLESEKRNVVRNATR